jgi:hypothetical protein
VEEGLGFLARAQDRRPGGKRARAGLLPGEGDDPVSGVEEASTASVRGDVGPGLAFGTGPNGSPSALCHFLIFFFLFLFLFCYFFYSFCNKTSNQSQINF